MFDYLFINLFIQGAACQVFVSYVKTLECFKVQPESQLSQPAVQPQAKHVDDLSYPSRALSRDYVTYQLD